MKFRIVEDAFQDKAIRGEANNLWSSILDNPYNIWFFHEGVAYLSMGNVDEKYADLTLMILPREMMGYESDAMTGRFPDNKTEYAIGIITDDVKEVVRGINKKKLSNYTAWRLRQDFIHEFIHYIDEKKGKGLAQTKKLIGVDRDIKYFNHPREFEAHYLELVNDIEEETLREWKRLKTKKEKREFLDFRMATLGKFKEMHYWKMRKRFIKKLTPENKKKFNKRFNEFYLELKRDLEEDLTK